MACLCLLAALAALLEFLPITSNAGEGDLVAYASLLFLAGVCLAPAVVGYMRHQEFRLYEPPQAAATATLLYLCFQVFALMRENAFRFVNGNNYVHQVPRLALYASLALLAFYIGYYASRHSGTGRTVKSALSPRLVGVKTLSYAVSAIVVLQIILWLQLGNIPVASLWAIGNARYVEWNSSAGNVIGFLVGARGSIAACVLLIIGTRSSKRWGIGHLVLVLLPFAFLSAMGSRTLAMNVLLGAFLFYFSERNKNPRAIVTFGAVAMVLVYIGFVGFYRLDRDIRVDRATSGDIFDEVVDSSKLSIASAAILDHVPRQVGYAYGKSYLNAVVALVPSVVWPAKHEVLNLLRDRSVFAALLTDWVGSWFAWVELYRNFGVIGIVAGMAILGGVSGRIADYYVRNKDSTFAQTYIVIFWLYLFTIYSRPDPSSAMVRAILFFWPIAAVHFVSKRLTNTRTNARK